MSRRQAAWYCAGVLAYTIIAAATIAITDSIVVVVAAISIEISFQLGLIVGSAWADCP